MAHRDLEQTPAHMLTSPQTAAQSTDSDSAGKDGSEPPHAHRERGLFAIGLFKLSKAVFFFCLGLGALRLIHVNLGELALRVATELHFDPEGQFVNMLQDKADLVSGHQLREASFLSIGYSVIALTEGIGLLMEQVWAEYLTTILTAGALPWETFELWRKPTSVRIALLIINLLVLAYLLWFLKRKRRQEGKAAAAAQGD